ncbi:succinate dehydrogenase assembly factor 2 [Zooshikella marina]|uniref:FAD assembly factor SdhE n=1 Tax=Zooshikella ganghwensis TaxID=202772 RepID=UPI000408FFF3|nr:succinate dehydrogenase assembly factor 2 [Zooshikella ganghwensis]MBU2705725.1 succinate dehydrogenase assembly factor 2 [Zooshikella ganghwensis]
MLSVAEHNRLFWRSRRGMLELDVLLVPFVKEAFPLLSEENQARYKKLIDCEDPDLFRWFMQKEQPDDPELAIIVEMILNHVPASS